VAALLLPSSANAGGPTMQFGVAEQDLRGETLVQAKASLTIARLAGFRSLRYAMIAWPGLSEPDELSLGMLGNVASAARLNGIRLYVAVYNPGSSSTPLTEEAQEQFADYTAAMARAVPYARDIIVGNEPNLNRFWLPQFEEDGSNAAAPAYLSLLSRTYDTLKDVSRRIRVIGGALAPRGADNPNAQSHAHSPTTFIRDLGAAYRASGRAQPIMDAFAIHPYQPNSSLPPTTKNNANRSIAIADYEKLVRLLGEAFDGTAQHGSTLPIVYAEYGVEARIPAGKRRFYKGTEPASVRAVTEAAHARHYRQALGIAFCQPNVEAMFIFHLYDEKDLDRWQSGLYYTDRTARRVTLNSVRKAIAEGRRGVLAKCPGLKLRPKVQSIKWPRGRIAAGTKPFFRLKCSIDCKYTATVVGAKSKPVLKFSGRIQGTKLKKVIVKKALKAGTYRLQLALLAPVNPGRELKLRGPAFITGTKP
jgi:hypothetical protein